LKAIGQVLMQSDAVMYVNEALWGRIHLFQPGGGGEGWQHADLCSLHVIVVFRMVVSVNILCRSDGIPHVPVIVWFHCSDANLDRSRHIQVPACYTLSCLPYWNCSSTI